MSFSIDIIQKRLVSPIDVLEEIRSKQAKGYQLIGIINRRESITEEQWDNVLTGPRDTTLSQNGEDKWAPMRRMMNQLAVYEIDPLLNKACDHFHITITSENKGVMGWVFVSIDDRVQQRREVILGEWEVIKLWLQQSWEAETYYAPSPTRSEINRLMYPTQTSHDTLIFNTSNWGGSCVYPFLLSYGRVAMTKWDEHAHLNSLWKNHANGNPLIAVLQVNVFDYKNTYFVEELSRLIVGNSAHLKCQCVKPNGQRSGYNYVNKNDQPRYLPINVNYILLYSSTLTTETITDYLNTFFSEMRQSLSLDWLFRSHFVKIGITNADTLALIKDQDLFVMHPNIFDGNNEIDLTSSILFDDYEITNKIIYHPRPYTENVLTESRKKDISSVLTFS